MDNTKDRFQLKFRDGRVLETTRDTLCAVRGSVLDVMFRNAGKKDVGERAHLSAKPDTDGTYFFDRDCDMFNALLNRLALGDRPALLSDCPETLASAAVWKAELDYWCLLPTEPTPLNTKKRERSTENGSDDDGDTKKIIDLKPEIETALEIMITPMSIHQREWENMLAYHVGECNMNFKDEVCEQNSGNATIFDNAGISDVSNVSTPRLRLYRIADWLIAQWRSGALASFYTKKFESVVNIAMYDSFFCLRIESNKKPKLAEN